MADNKRIAKNTMILYFRMMLVMLVSLYTSRVILRNLGVEDYGLYNVVGGIVSMFTFLNGSLGAATSRYITFELGKKDYSQLNKIFNTALIIHIIIGLIIILLSETIGLWFFYNKMTIPAERLDAAFWTYQISIFTCSPRQLLLYRLLDLPSPRFCHFPLLLSHDGRRLSKRDADAGLEALMGRLGPEEILGRLAYLGGFHPSAAAASAEELLAEFDWAKVPKEDIPIPQGLFS